MALEATSDLVVGQWFDSPRLRATIDAPITVANDDILPAFDQLAAMQTLETAEGVWLDYLGVRIGVRRPTQRDPSMDDRFGFDMSGGPFDLEPFRGDAANDAVYPLNDDMYRRFVIARVILDFGDGTIQTFKNAIRAIDPGAAVQDQRNMTVRVVTIIRTFLELADEAGALPRSAGVRIIYADRQRFGFDMAGQPMDVGSLTPDTA